MFLKHHHSIAPRYYSGHCSSWLTASYVGEQLPDVLWLAVTSIASGHLWSTSLASSGTTKRFLATTKTFAFASCVLSAVTHMVKHDWGDWGIGFFGG